jgi:HK97 family phage portal protein
MNINPFSYFGNFRAWWGRGGALAETIGQQVPVPSGPLNAGTQSVTVDGALQISTVWACIDRRATTIASLPFFAYQQVDGQKQLARNSRLFAVLHDSPNSRMTPFDFWRAMMMNYDLRGNAYARIERDDNGEVVALWPMPADQVEVQVLEDGSMVYLYLWGPDMAVFAAENVLHIKNLGNGTMGLAKLEFMRSTTDEAAKAQGAASRMFGADGKPTGVLMLDKVLNESQRKAMQARFTEMSVGNTSRLYLLEANMKYEQLSLSPEDQQLLETRQFGVAEICRWFDTPPVLVHADATQWGTGIYEIKDGFYTLAIRPTIINIEQAVRKQVLTARQRATMHAEFSLDALLRGDPVKRAEINAKNVQNGLKSRAEVRQLEGDPYIEGTDVLTAQSNLVPLSMLGKVAASGGSGANIAQ